MQLVFSLIAKSRGLVLVCTTSEILASGCSSILLVESALPSGCCLLLHLSYPEVQLFAHWHLVYRGTAYSIISQDNWPPFLLMWATIVELYVDMRMKVPGDITIIVQTSALVYWCASRYLMSLTSSTCANQPCSDASVNISRDQDGCSLRNYCLAKPPDKFWF